MSERDDTATAAPSDTTATGEPPDDPDVARAALAADVGLDAAAATRLRHESSATRARVEQRLVTAGHLREDGALPVPPDAAERHPCVVTDVDAWRELDDLLDEHVDLVERIDALHDRRLRSGSPRERQAATRVLAEALHRIIEGYDVEIERPKGAVATAGSADEWVGRHLGRLAGTRRPRAALRWWAAYGRWVRLGAALVAAVLLCAGAFVAAAVVVALRSSLSAVLFDPKLPDGRPNRVLGYDPAWAACVCTHLGDASIVVGLGVGLHAAGHPGWGAAAAFGGLFSLLATMLRVASGHHGFRLGRLWLDRLAVTSALVVVTAAAATGGPEGPGAVPMGVALAALMAVGVVEIARTVYWAFRRRRLFRQDPPVDTGPVSDVLVARTGDAVVMNIPRRGPRARVVGPAAGPPAGADGPHLRVVGGADG